MGRRAAWVLSVCLVGWSASPGHAQVTPTSPAPQTPPPQPAPKPAPNDAPSVRVGGTLFLDYTYTESPDITDADGNRVNSSAFNVGRGYINITGQVNHLVAFRITPDISRETGAGSSLNGSLTYRLKYAYGQFNLDDWMWQGTWVRLGMQPTPVVNFEEDVYRYRFQGPTFADREGYLSSSDFGVAFRTLFPKDRGELMTGFYNGETYSQAETNDQKAFQVRGTVRPFVGSGPERGLRLTVFYDADHYVQDAERRRLETIVSFEHKYVNAAWVFLDAADRTSIGVDDVDGQGHSLWVTPRSTFGLEGLLRYDRLAPDHRNESLKERWIAGVAYWPKVSVATVSSAIMLDYEYVHYARFAPARPTERRVFVHMLVSF